MSYSKKALNQYNTVALKTAVSEASPHELVNMLFAGALTAISRAKGLIGQKDMAGKGEQINKASRILVHLKGSLDLEKGGEVAANLDPLYDYMIQRLAIANSDLDVSVLDEVSTLLNEVKAGWVAMPEK
ncbi:MAG: flagellar export chaperone FliS [Motiliproteus sp.]